MISAPTDTGTPAPRPHWPRRCARVALSAEVIARSPGKLNYAVKVQDASPHGCRVEFVERPRLGDRTWIKFDGLEALEAFVCWVDGFVGGVEFEKTIHPAVFAQLMGKLR